MFISMKFRLPLFALILLLCISAHAQSYQYTLSWQNPRTHLYTVGLTADPAAGAATNFEIPAWRPGRYYIQDYAAAATAFNAVDQAGKALAWHKVDNHTWQVSNPASGPITISYQYYANTMDAGSCVLDPSMAYFNPSNLFAHVRGRYDLPCTLRVSSMPESWKSATALIPVAGTHNVFTAPDYHDFVDAPTVLSPTLKTLQSRIHDVDYYFHFQGAFPNDKATEDACQANMDKIIREQEGIFGEMPFKSYHFIYHLVPFNIGHAVEHKYSSCYALPATVAQSPSAIARLNSITAHEFFHLWNVKRIRPAAMWPYDYQKEAFTTLQWFTEGVTDYYADLTLVRSGLITREQFYNIMAKTVESLENNYASKAISCEQSSFDSWLERSDFQIPYHRISYYTLGTRAGLILDLAIRQKSMGRLSLDDLFRKLYTEYYKQGKGLEEDGVLRAVSAMTGQDFTDFFLHYIQRPDPVPYQDFLAAFGLELKSEDRAGAGWAKVGIEKFEENGNALLVTKVRPGTDIERAGLGEGELIVEVNGTAAKEFDAKAYFAEFKRPKKMDLKVAGYDGEKTIELEWTGTWSPKTWTMAQKEKLKKDESDLLEAWLKSCAK